LQIAGFRLDRPRALDRLGPNVQGREQAHYIDQVPNRDRGRIGQRPPRLRVTRQRVGEEPHEERKGRRVVVGPAVMVEDLVEWISRPDRPAGAEKDLHVALPKPDGLAHDDGKKSQNQDREHGNGKQFPSPEPRDRAKSQHGSPLNERGVRW
jgi:hypothetical protein